MRVLLILALIVAVISPLLSPSVHASGTVPGSALFGESVAISANGKSILVGAPDATVTLRDGTSVHFGGAAFLYNGQGKLVQTFTDTSPVTFEQYAYSVSISPDGSLILIGAPMAGSSGIAFLYNRGGQLIRAYAPPTVAGSGSGFGWSVSFITAENATVQTPSVNDSSARPDVIIGAIFATSQSPQGSVGGAGQVYMFDLKGTLLRTYSDPFPTVDENFGLSLAAASDGSVVVGAPDAATVTSTGQVIAGTGKALLFDPSGNLVSTFSDPTPSFFEQFGFSVSVLGNSLQSLDVFIGEPSAGRGAVFIFNSAGSPLVRILDRSPNCFEFGNSVSTSTLQNGTVSSMVTGAPLCLQGSGQAFLFRTDTSTVRTMVDPSPMPGEKFGFSVAMAAGGSRVVIGALFRGNAFVFDGSGNLLLVL